MASSSSSRSRYEYIPVAKLKFDPDDLPPKNANVRTLP